MGYFLLFRIKKYQNNYLNTGFSLQGITIIVKFVLKIMGF